MIKSALPCVLIAAAVMVAYAHVGLTYPFVKWDDYAYILQNEPLHGSFFSMMRYVFTSEFHGNYFPLHQLSYALEIRLFGANPMWFHINNILLHAFNALLIYKLFSLYGYRTPALIAALLFAVHPTHVESVAWISERKDTLYLFFFLLTFITLRTYQLRRKTVYLAGAVFLYICSVLSKSTAVVFPVLFFITELTFDRPVSAQRLIKLLWVFVLIAAGAVGVQIILKDVAEVGGDALPVLKIAELFLRYIAHLVYPVNLSPRYDSLADVPFFFIFTGYAVLLYGCIRLRIFRWATAWMLIALLPVLNLVPIPIIMADRYHYLASIGMYLAFGYFCETLLIRSSSTAKRRTVTGLVGSVSVILTLLTINQATIWKNTHSLWFQAVQSNPDDVFPIMNLALMIYHETGDMDKAITALELALEVDPDSTIIHYQLGAVYYNEGYFDTAKKHLTKVLSIPNARLKHPEAFIKLAHIEALLGNFTEEIAVLQQGLVTELHADITKLLEDAYDRRRLVRTAEAQLERSSPDMNGVIIASRRLIESGFASSARYLLDAARSKSKDNQEIIFLSGLACLLDNDMDTAISFFSSYTDTSQTFPAYFAGLMAMRSQVSDELLIKRLESGLHTYPGQPVIHLEYGIGLVETGLRPYKAVDIYRDMFARKPAWQLVPRMLYFKKVLRDKNLLVGP